MKLYLDDIREPKTKGWLIARDATSALELIQTGLVKYISFDHDLGEDSPTGYDVAKRVELLVGMGIIPMPEWNVHSANPVGAKNIALAMNNAEKIYEEIKV